MLRLSNCPRLGAILVLGTLAVSALSALPLQRNALSADGQKIENVMVKLRQMSDAERAVATKKLALSIRQLPAGNEKVMLASGLGNVATEGDFGRDTLQEVTTTLDKALAETPQPPDGGGAPAFAYSELAQIARYEHMKVSLKSSDYATALKAFDTVDAIRSKADFTLNDISGQSWTLSALKGKIVLVNFWATWCPPCRKEMPDLETLYNRFKDKGFVILAISDEAATKVSPFIETNKYTYPILLDPGRKINELYKVDGIPKSFIYDRSGKLVAQAIDMRTMNQFLSLLGRAGLK